ncbi:hypothetical protein CEXT_108801 [Caerostris extrusa]|uniref:Uncharacterized protein n=1 Tax=Caerostris extrusa TaxID=172846 RepID=A0AAV4R164_CAEEX|nr:hypothetical protein CEXT_108801 [Caerostris extrusa]
MPSGGSEKRRRKMKSASFHSTRDIPKDGQGCAKQEKERALPADCLLPVLVYDAHGRRKHYFIEHLEARGNSGLRKNKRAEKCISPEKNRRKKCGVVGQKKRRRKMKSISFHSTWMSQRTGRDVPSRKKRRALPADCLLPVLFYDAHG